MARLPLRRLLRSPWLLGAMSCVAVVGVTSLLAHYIWQSDIREAKSIFRQLIIDSTDDIESKLRGYEQLVRALALITNEQGMASASQKWPALSQRLQPVQGGSPLVSLSLVGYIPKAEMYPGRLLTGNGGDSAMPEFAAPLLNIARDLGSNSLIGYDLNADSIRREALESARDSGSVAITSPLILLRDRHPGATPSFLLIAPVYRDAVPDIQAERRANIRGYVVAAYRMQDLLSAILPRLDGRISITISDSSDDFAPLIYFENAASDRRALFQDRHGLLIADRVWQITYATTSDYEATLHRQHTVRIVAVGFLLALLVGVLVWRLTRSWNQAESMAHGASGELRRYQTLLRTVLDVIPEPVLVKDRNFKLVMVNQAYADRAGESVSALLGRETHEFMPAQQANRLVASDVAVFETEEDQVFELSIPNRMLNSVRNYIVTKRLAHDVDGNPISVGIHHDVTELRRRIAEFAAVIEQTPLVAVQGFDRNCVLTHWNKASENLFRYSATQAIGSRLQDLILERRLQHIFERVVEEAWLEQRTFGPGEVRMHLPDGRRLVLLLTLFPIVIEGRVLEVFCMAVDVSARHEAEKLLALHRDNLQSLVDERTAGLLRTKQELELALQARSEFLANISHELRTPMHAVLSFARLGEERLNKMGAEVPDKLQDYFARIVLSGERLLALINNLLDLSKMEAGKMSLERRDIDLVALVHEAAAELAPLLEKQQLRLVLPTREQSIQAEVDPAQILQVLANLLSNAIRYSPPNGCISIDLMLRTVRVGRRASDSREYPGICLRVSDEGPGIPATELELIFDKFVQSSMTRTGAGGTGLGLSICREIVQAHQGSIVASNRAEGGACFEVVLPIRPQGMD